MARVVALGDTHCGNEYGLTPPEWWGGKNREGQEKAWKQYLELVQLIGPVDYLLFTGDLIDGKQRKSGGRELLTSDRAEQAEMGATCISAWHAPRIFMARGTGYHTGNGENFEDIAARSLGAEILDDATVGCGKSTFHVRHKVGRGSLVHTRGTPLLKTYLNGMWREAEGLQQPAHIFIRGHVHYHLEVSGPGFTAATVPSLATFSEFGSRLCDGVVHWGVLVYDIGHQGGPVKCQAYTRKLIKPTPHIKL